MLCKRANFRSERIKKALANLTLCGFRSLYDTLFLYRTERSPDACYPCSYLQIPCAAVVAFCTSWFLVAMAWEADRCWVVSGSNEQVDGGLDEDCLSLKEEI